MNKRTAWVLTCLLICSFSIAQKHTNRPAHPKKNTDIHYGTASFYANKFEGRRTASGDIFSQKKMTAASNILSLNTWVKVTNMHNKRAVVVKINDRMHRNNKRLIDLSHAAARKLGYTGRGLTKVQVEVLGKKRPAGWVAEAGEEGSK